MDARNNIAQDLFYKIRSRFSGLKLGADTGEITINPEEARFFDFDYMEEETPIGHVSISLAEPNSMKVYFSHGITESMSQSQKTNWYGFLKELRMFAKRRLLNFDTRDIAKDNLDKRDFLFLSQNVKPVAQSNIQNPVGESVMNESSMYGTKTVSYQKLENTRLIIKHNQALTDDQAPGARSRHISALFVENADGERFKYPFIHLAGARAMQRHVANGGLPYDEIGKSIIGMSEEIAQLRSFGNYVVRNDLMNSANNGIVERSTSYLNTLREQIKALAKQKNYEAYKETFQAQQPLEVPQDVVEQFTDQFTIRNFKEDIKSVFPVLYRLMQEDNTIGYDDIVEMTKDKIQNEEAEREQDDRDPFDQFESWVMALGEESSIQSVDKEEQAYAIKQLQELVGQEFPAGVDGANAIDSLKGIIDDAGLFKDIKSAATSDPKTDVRSLIKDWLDMNVPDVASEINFGDLDTSGDDQNIEDPMAYADQSADADAIAYGQREGYDMNEASSYAHDFDTEYESESAVAAFDVGADGRPVVTKIMLGNTDITKVVSEDDKAEIAANIDLSDYAEGEEKLSYDNYLELNLQVEYNIFGKDLPGTWDNPPEYAELDGYAIHVVGEDGSMVEIDERDLGPEGRDWIEEKIWAHARASRDDNDYYDYNESEETDQPTQGKQKMNVQELAEFIQSFYDKDSGTFPKGPEGVCTMVGKKFGEQAEQVARKFVERMAPQQADASINELARIRELSGLRSKDAEVNELDYKSFAGSDELAELRDAIDKNVVVSVAFVKKDGTVKHMGIKKNISSYVPSSREKTDRQANVEANNDIKKVVDINAYIKSLKELKATGMEEEQAKAEASKKAWRSINLKNVLGFMVKGKFIDLRDENEIQQRFGDEIYNSVTPAMKSALAQSQQATESFNTGDSEVDEARGGSSNFTADDIHELEKMDDVEQIKGRAIELISTPSKKPMKPEKISYFKNKIAMMKSKMDIVKLMYDLLLSGEGFGVVGSRNSMGANSYRQRFGDSIETESNDEIDRLKKLSGM